MFTQLRSAALILLPLLLSSQECSCRGGGEIRSASWENGSGSDEGRGASESLPFELATQEGHKFLIMGAAVSPDGKFLASGSGCDELKLWHIDGKFIRNMRGHKDLITSVSFSPDGKQILTSSEDKTVRIWTNDGRPVRVLNHMSGVKCAAYSPDGRVIVSGGGEEFLRVWDMDGEQIKTVRSPGNDSFYRVTFRPDGSIIASSYHSLCVWNADGEFVSQVLNAHSEKITGIASSPDGKLIASSSYDRTVKIWSAAGVPLHTLKGNAQYATTVAFSPDGSRLAAGYGDGSLCIWTAGGRALNTVAGDGNPVSSVLFAESGMITASGKSIRVRKSDGTVLRSFSDKTEYLNSLAFNDADRTITARSSSHTYTWSLDGRLVSAAEGGCPCRYIYGNGVPARLDKALLPLTVTSPSGNYRCVLDGKDSTEFNILKKDGTVEQSYNLGASGAVFDIAFSPDDSYFVTAGSSCRWGRLYDTRKGLKATLVADNDVCSVSVSPDGNTIATGSFGGMITLWDRSGRLLRRLKGHRSDITNLVFSRDGKFLASSADATISLWNLQTGDNAFMLSSGEDWLLYTADGYFDSSRRGGSLISMVKGLNVSGIDQFALRNNRPDIILQRLGTCDSGYIDHLRSLYLRRLARLGMKESSLRNDALLPEVRILDAVQEGEKKDGKFMNIRFEATDAEYSLARYNIYVNDVPLFAEWKTISGHRSIISERVELTSGGNKIEVTCLNDNGAESIRALTFASYAAKKKGDLYLLGFGVSRYKEKSLDLQYAHKDAADIEAALKLHAQDFDSVHSRIYLNEEATKDALTGSTRLLDDAKADDTFILFIAGHGMHDSDAERTYYFLPHDGNPGDLRNTAVSFEEIEKVLRFAAPRKKLLLVDTCESGDIDDTAAATSFSTAKKMGIIPRTGRAILLGPRDKKARTYGTWHFQDRYIYNDLLRRSGAIVFASSLGGEFSYEDGRLRNGLFTSQLLLGLKGAADANHDAVITVDELCTYVSKRVAEQSGGIQHPVRDRDNISMSFGFSRR